MLRGFIKRLFLSAEDQKFGSALKNILGFFPGNIAIYRLSFKHKSAAIEIKEGVKASNERLEFLGDSILDAVVSSYLFKKYPFEDEGFLTQMRSKIVSRKQLNHLAVELGIDSFIKANISHSLKAKSINGDALEAIIGAIYLDKGFEVAEKFILNRLIDIMLDIDELEQQELNYKSKLIEWSQKEKKEVDFKLVSEVEVDNRKQFHVQVIIDKKVMGSGKAFSKKIAEQMAAEQAVLRMEKSN